MNNIDCFLFPYLSFWRQLALLINNSSGSSECTFCIGIRTAVVNTRRQGPVPAVTRITIIRRWRIMSLVPTTSTARRPMILDQRKRRSRTPSRPTHPRPSPRLGCCLAWSPLVSSALFTISKTWMWISGQSY